MCGIPYRGGSGWSDRDPTCIDSTGRRNEERGRLPEEIPGAHPDVAQRSWMGKPRRAPISPALERCKASDWEIETEAATIVQRSQLQERSQGYARILGKDRDTGYNPMPRRRNESSLRERTEIGEDIRVRRQRR